MNGLLLGILVTCLAIYTVEFVFLDKILNEIREIKRYLRKRSKEET